MAVAKAQAAVTNTGTSSGSVALTLGSAPTTGNIMVALITCPASNTAHSAPAGWLQIGTLTTNGTGQGASMWRRVVQAGDTAGPYTFTTTGTPNMQGYLVELHGQDATTPIDASNSATGSSTSPVTGNATPSAAGGYAFGSFVYNGSSTTFAGTPTNSYTSDANNVGSHSEFVSKAAPASGVATSSGDTLAVSKGWIGQIVVVKASSGTPAKRPGMMLMGVGS